MNKETNLFNKGKTFESFTHEENLKILEGKVERPFFDKISFGISFLDDALSGIIPKDIIVIAAGTGVGKSQLAAIIAQKAGVHGKKTILYALESSENEVFKRLIFSEIMQLFYKDKENKNKSKYIRFTDFTLNSFETEEILKPYYNQACENLKESLKKLEVREISNQFDFSVDHIEKEVAPRDDVSLVIVDHLHYMELDETKNENAQMTKIVKKLSLLAEEKNIAVVLFAQLRKPVSMKVYKSDIPELTDIMGTSNISKLAKKVILFRSGEVIPQFENSQIVLSETFVRIGKSRLEGESLSFYSAKILYNVTLKKYNETYELGQFKKGEWEPFLKPPRWAQNNNCSNSNIKPITNLTNVKNMAIQNHFPNLSK